MATHRTLADAEAATGTEIKQRHERTDGGVTLTGEDGSQWRVYRKRDRRTERYGFELTQTRPPKDTDDDGEDD